MLSIKVSNCIGDRGHGGGYGTPMDIIFNGTNSSGYATRNSGTVIYLNGNNLTTHIKIQFEDMTNYVSQAAFAYYYSQNITQ